MNMVLILLLVWITIMTISDMYVFLDNNFKHNNIMKLLYEIGLFVIAILYINNIELLKGIQITYVPIILSGIIYVYTELLFCIIKTVRRIINATRAKVKISRRQSHVLLAFQFIETGISSIFERWYWRDYYITCDYRRLE